MAFDLGTLIRAAAMGGTAYQRAQRDQEDRTRQQRQEDAETERRKKADARAAAQEERDAITEALRQDALRQDIKNYRPPAIPKPYRGTVNGATGEFGTSKELAEFMAEMNALPNPATRDTRRPDEVEMDALRRRELEARLAGAERDNMVETAPQSDPTIEQAIRLQGSLSGQNIDPADDADMNRMIQRNALIRSLINDHGLTREEAEREARRRLGPG